MPALLPDFVPYMKSDDADLITIAIQKVFDEKLDVLSALNWLRGQSGRDTTHRPQW